MLSSQVTPLYGPVFGHAIDCQYDVCDFVLIGMKNRNFVCLEMHFVDIRF